MFITLIVFIIILGLLIFVHELGHFIAAKRSGVKVEEFAFGFPPRLFAIKKGETEYAINLFPIGGYVKMLGETEDATSAEKHNSRSFAHQSVWVRSKVVVAGVLMNIVLAWLLMSIGYMLGMAPVVTPPERIPYAHSTTAVAISAVSDQSVAQSMGMKPADLIFEFNGTPITTKEQLSKLTKEHRDQEVTIKLKRKGQEMIVKGKLGKADAPLGVALSDDTKVKLPWWWAPIWSVWETIKTAGFISVGIVSFFKQLLVSRQVPPEAAGPVGIFYFTRTVLELGFTALLNFIAVLSINLAIINILPVPALDGGRLLFIILEKVNRGRKVVNQQIENVAHTIGFALLIILIMAITYNDILRLGQ